MKDKRFTILYNCSWLDHKSSVGIFFIEQGELFLSEYNVVFLYFKKTSIRNILSFKPLFKVEKGSTENGSLVIYASYPYFLKLGLGFLKILQRTICRKVHQELIQMGRDPDLIHAQSLLDAGIFSYYYSKMFEIPYFITEHNKISFLNKNIYRYDLIVEVLNRSKVNLVVSNEKIKQFACNDLFFPFQVVGNLVNDSIFNYSRFYRAKVTPSKSKFRIVTIGAFSPIKDHETLFKALEILDPLVQNIDFTWVGPCSWGGVKLMDIERFYKKFKLKNISIIVVPEATRNEVAEILYSADVFVMSSLVEGFPVSVLEALASGVPVISSMCGGVEDIIGEHNGRLYPIRDFQKLANYLMMIYQDKWVIDKKAISEEVISKFGKESFRKKLESFYQTILN